MDSVLFLPAELAHICTDVTALHYQLTAQMWISLPADYDCPDLLRVNLHLLRRFIIFIKLMKTAEIKRVSSEGRVKTPLN